MDDDTETVRWRQRQRHRRKNEEYRNVGGADDMVMAKAFHKAVHKSIMAPAACPVATFTVTKCKLQNQVPTYTDEETNEKH